MASSSAVGKVSREEFRRQKDLDAARKAGTAPAELDAEGRPINPHIPQYISQAPWYLDSGQPSLSHQRKSDKPVVSDIDKWYERGKKAGPAATKYRKGACENCGVMTHKRADCPERPRKKGARYTGRNIMADDVVQDVAQSYDAKRDRWNGYDPAEHKRVYEEFAAIEAARQKLREEEIDKQTTTDLAAVRKVAKAGKGEGDGGDPDFGSSDEEDGDEEKYADAADAVGQKLDTKTRITVRNLRIREDTAKYLINLDPESAYYDPKTRSMRDAPLREVPAEDAKFAGDNFFRYSGEAPDVQRLQLFAWQSAARGNDVHLNANPTQGEVLHKQYREKKEELRDTQKVGILAKYGGEEYLEKAPKELLQGQTEEYVEYSRTGQVIKGREKAKAKSKYMEDVYVNNHTSVWGSWYDLSSSQWGYACCQSILHVSYCSGLAGIEAAKSSSAQNLLATASSSANTFATSSKSLAEAHQERMEKAGGERDAEAGDRGKVRDEKFGASKWKLGEGDMQLDHEKLAEAIKEEKKRKSRANEDEDEDDRGRKKKYNSNLTGGTDSHEITEEELEAYRRHRMAGTEDPMFNYTDKGGDYV